MKTIASYFPMTLTNTTRSAVKDLREETSFSCERSAVLQLIANDMKNTSSCVLSSVELIRVFVFCVCKCFHLEVF